MKAKNTLYGIKDKNDREGRIVSTSDRSTSVKRRRANREDFALVELALQVELLYVGDSPVQKEWYRW
jgi:hypothetical protein